MLRKKGWLIALISVFILGWSLGYLSLPYLPDRFQFFIGAVSVIVALTLFFILGDSLLSKYKRSIVLLSFLIILISGGLYTFDRLLNKRQLVNQKKEQLMMQSLSHEIDMNYAQEKVYQKRIVEKLIDSFEEIRSPDSLIKSIEQLYWKLPMVKRNFNDSVIEISPGRGYLLQTILKANISDTIKRELIVNLDFSNADLESVIFQDEDLRGIRLKNAILYKADLSGSLLQGSDLRASILRECMLDRVNLNDANLELADASWSSINKANLTSIFAWGADFSFTSIQNAYLDSAQIRWCDFNQSILRNTSFIFADLMSSLLMNADFSGSDLRNSRLSRAVFFKTILEESRLGNNPVSKDWLDRLAKQEVEGRDEILKNYTIVIDSSNYFNVDRHFLKHKTKN